MDLVNGLVETSEELEVSKYMEDRERLDYIEKFRLSASSKYDEPEYTIEQNGQGFAPKGNIMALMAEMKHGKTFVNMSIAAAILHGEFLGLKGKVENAKVLFFDTEQDEADGQRIMRRVHYVCGWDFNTDNERFQVYHLREIPFNERRTLIADAIKFFRPDVVFIDGIRDLLQDFNDLAESAGLIQELMTLSSKYHTAIWTVLHVNPNSEKMRGHLGTELGNKVTDVFKVTKKKDAGLVTFEVEHMAARHRDVDGWTFRIDDDKPYGIPVLVGEEEKESIAKTEYEQKMDGFKNKLESKMVKGKTYSYTDVRTFIGGANDKANERIKSMVERNVLKIIDGRYALTDNVSKKTSHSDDMVSHRPRPIPPYKGDRT